MQSLFQTEQTQVEILNFQTFTTEYVATRYGITTSTINDHKRLHNDEILENIHFIVEKNDRNRPIIKWTLRGIIKLGMFIRSKEAKNFRLWAEMELEKSINKELENARATSKRNIELSDKISNLEAIAISKQKHHNLQINGYKSQIIQHNNKINELKTELKRYGEMECQISSSKNDKTERQIIALSRAQKDLEMSFKKISAVMADLNGDEFFINRYFKNKGDKQCLTK